METALARCLAWWGSRPSFLLRHLRRFTLALLPSVWRRTFPSCRYSRAACFRSINTSHLLATTSGLVVAVPLPRPIACWQAFDRRLVGHGSAFMARHLNFARLCQQLLMLTHGKRVLGYFRSVHEALRQIRHNTSTVTQVRLTPYLCQVAGRA